LNKPHPPLAITPGEPAGIGPDLCIQYAAEHAELTPIVLVTDPALIRERAELLGIDINIAIWSDGPCDPGTVNILPVTLKSPARPGILDINNSSFVLETLNQAVSGCLSGQFSGLVTGPVQKSIINQAGFSFSGHTEYLADLCETETVVMMLATQGLRVALVTTHLPLAEVPAAITPDLLRKVIRILHRDLQQKFGITEPEIVVAGLNPHAGEDGHLGLEEIDTIIPAMDACRHDGIHLVGPLPADTLFTPRHLATADAVLAMYHDQGLPVLKYEGFGNAVNITLGLPIIRTSVDHGTALDLAGTGKASTGSLVTAIDAAREMASYWNPHG